MSEGLITLRKSFVTEVVLNYLVRNDVELILFLSRVINGVESRYWLTELELAGIVWVVRKIRYMIEFLSALMIVFTDYGAALGIVR